MFQSVPMKDTAAILVSHPVRYDGEVPGVRAMSLAPGADTRPILEQAGFSAAELADLVRNKVVFTPEDAT
jgi:crotonobetainyl-CoA:carnitine CoA-transferase CaiB-like acyl-CoA transferase